VGQEAGWASCFAQFLKHLIIEDTAIFTHSGKIKNLTDTTSKYIVSLA